MIKFPNTLSEYTDGKLWHGKTEESIAKRILYNLYAIDDKKELADRKLYLAHFYADKGSYFLSAKILRELLLDMDNIQDIIRLLEKDYIQMRDAKGVSEAFRLMSKYDKDEEKRFAKFLRESENADFGDIDEEGDYAEYSNGQVRYFRDGELLYSLEDNDYRTFVANIQATGELNAGMAQNSVKILDKIQRRHIKEHTLMSINVTYVKAYMNLGDYEKAFEYCEKLIGQNLYIQAMVDLMLIEKSKGNMREYNAIKEFLSSKKDLGTDDLVELSVLIKEDEDELWHTLCKNNPFDEKDCSEERYLLEGIIYYNEGESEKAEDCWYKADSLYGIFSRAKSYLYFLEKFGGIDKSQLKLTLERQSAMDDLLRVTLTEKLKNCNTKEEFALCAKEAVIALNSILTNTLPSLQDTADIMYQLYAIGYQPITSVIKNAIVDDEYYYIVRIIALACFAALSGKKHFIFEGNEYKNPIADLDKSGGREKIVFVLALYFAQSVLREGKTKSRFIKKMYSLLRKDYSKAPSLAFFWLLLKIEGMNDSPEIYSFCSDKNGTLQFLYDFKEDMVNNLEENIEEKFCQSAYYHAAKMERIIREH